MAKNSSLRQRLRTSGGLAETSVEELAKSQGRPLSPTTPSETGVIGGNPDQAKMAGTGQQKIGALRQALQGADDLATATRREQVRTKATGEEEQTLSSEERLAQLGGMESRVQQLAEQALATGAAQDQDVQLQAGGEDQAIELLNRLRDNPEDIAAIKEFNNLMGITEVEGLLSSQDILSNFDVTLDPVTGKATLGGSGIDELGGALATSVQDRITSGELNFQEMGFTDINEVASLLGTDAEALGNMTITEMHEQLQAQIADEYSTVEDLRSRANDMSLGAAERAEARKMLRESGAVGIRSAETDVDILADEIEESNTVTFMDEELTTEELLDNDYVSGLVLNYFNNPDFAEQLEESEPDLVDFIKRHENVLLDSVAEMDESLGSFAALNQQNLALASLPDNETLDDEVMKAWGYSDFGDITTESYQPNAAISYLKDTTIPAPRRQDLKGNIDKVKNVMGADSADLQQFGQLSPAELSHPALTDRNSREHKEFNTYYDMVDTIKNADPNDPNAAARALGAADMADLENQMREVAARENSGLFSPIGGDDALMKDIFSGTPQEALDNLKRNYLPGGNSVGLRRAISGEGVPRYKQSYDEIGEMNARPPDPVFALVKDKFAEKPNLSFDDVKEIGNNATLDELDMMLHNPTLVNKNVEEGRFGDVLPQIITDKLQPTFGKLLTQAQGNPHEFMTLLEQEKANHRPNVRKAIQREIQRINASLPPEEQIVVSDRRRKPRPSAGTIEEFGHSPGDAVKGHVGRSIRGVAGGTAGSTGGIIGGIDKSVKSWTKKRPKW